MATTNIQRLPATVTAPDTNWNNVSIQDKALAVLSKHDALVVEVVSGTFDFVLDNDTPVTDFTAPDNSFGAGDKFFFSQIEEKLWFKGDSASAQFRIYG